MSNFNSLAATIALVIALGANTLSQAAIAAPPTGVAPAARTEIALPAGASAEQLMDAIRHNPNDLNLRRHLAQEWIKKGLTVKAAEQMRQVIGVAGQNADDLVIYADACRYSSDLTTAIAAYKRALTLAPMNARAWSGLSLAYATSGDITDAVKTCHSGLNQIADQNGRKELSGTLDSVQRMAPTATASTHVAS